MPRKPGTKAREGATVISQTGKTKGTYGAAKRLDQDPASVAVPVLALCTVPRRLAPQWSALAKAADISGEGLAVVEFDCEPCEFAFECAVYEGGH